MVVVVGLAAATSGGRFLYNMHYSMLVDSYIAVSILTGIIPSPRCGCSVDLVGTAAERYLYKMHYRQSVYSLVSFLGPRCGCSVGLVVGTAG